MLRENLRTESFDVALKKTFDGEHPCALCKNIQTGKRSEKKSEFPNEIKKLEFSYVRGTFVFRSPSGFRLISELDNAFSSLNQVPPLAPPKSLQS